MLFEKPQPLAFAAVLGAYTEQAVKALHGTTYAQALALAQGYLRHARGVVDPDCAEAVARRVVGGYVAFVAAMNLDQANATNYYSDLYPGPDVLKTALKAPEVEQAWARLEAAVNALPEVRQGRRFSLALLEDASDPTTGTA